MSISLGLEDALRPLPYHLRLVDHLQRAEPEVWDWASSFAVQEQHVQDMRSSLLRETYRLSPEAHPAAHAACAAVAAKLAIDAPITLYQAGAEAMNACLYYLPGEVHVVLHGAVLDKLAEEEFVALLGHELSHYRLWSMDGGGLSHRLAHPGPHAG